MTTYYVVVVVVVFKEQHVGNAFKLNIKCRQTHSSPARMLTLCVSGCSSALH